MSKENPTIREAFGEDTTGIKLIKTKKCNGLYSYHQSAPDDIIETKVHFEVSATDANLKEICKDFGIDYVEDDDDN